MNEKGIGFIGLFAFGAFALAAVFVFYSFVTSNLNFEKEDMYSPVSYTNEYKEFSKKDIYNEHSISSYYELENLISNYAEEYIYKYYNGMEYNDLLYIPLDAILYEENIEMKINNSNVNCSGYIRAIKINHIVSYDTYINCDSGYKTYGYMEIFDR